jgi:excisionase family DNA binding protein
MTCEFGFLMARGEPDTSRAPHDEVITADEVAALLRMTPAWVYSETRRNRIPHMRLGRYFRYRRSAIEAWMSAMEDGTDPGQPRRGV